MKQDIRLLLINTCGWIATLTVLIFFFTLLLFSYNQITEPLKESWSITFSAFSAFTTLGAAIIAASLFNDWRSQQQHQNAVQFGLYVYDSFKLLDKHLTELDNDLFYFYVDQKDFEKLESEFNVIKSTLEKRSDELMKLSAKFEEAYINYCIVCGKEDQITSDLEETSEDIYKYSLILDEIFLETDRTKIRENITLLTTDPLSEIGTKIYNFHIKNILGSICLK
ncbi:hypothetical protein [Acinetobacter calcoaceticus]|uniref:SMODS and SLOG-associating 2TM effector domain-containing protein n=1 Tax=Acinetobacter calcoaceticus TaxID=471 RepID=A0ABD5ALH6_ACICA|nr:hypothetical protein [Acinetobacter calcoaceticus]MDP9803211.1 hypothetical protein [Acinetobacter calcoaceticus]